MKIAFLFPGYGSQYVGMAKELYDESRLVQEYFEEASNCLDTNFVKLCFASSESDLARMDAAYTSLFLVSSAIHALLKQEGIHPAVLAGYNLGEYAAIHAAEGFSFPDGLYLLNKYALFYQEEITNKNFAIARIAGVPTSELEKICVKAQSSQEFADQVGGHAVSIAIYKSDHENVVSGIADAVELVSCWVEEQYPDAEIKRLGLEVGLHSLFMENVVKSLTVYLEKLDFKDLSVPLLSGVDAQIITSAEDVRHHVINHLNHPSVWTRVMEHLGECDLLVEIGPGSALSEMAKLLYPEKTVLAINKRADIELLKKMIQPSENINPSEE